MLYVFRKIKPTHNLYLYYTKIYWQLFPILVSPKNLLFLHFKVRLSIYVLYCSHAWFYGKLIFFLIFPGRLKLPHHIFNQQNLVYN
jgi:hypothetical protein